MSSGSSSIALFWMKKVPSVLPRKARKATGLEWGAGAGAGGCYGTGRGPVCGLWDRPSTLSFGGRKCTFHIFPGREESSDLEPGSL